MRPDNLRRGAFYIITAAALFAVMGAMVKRVSTTLPNEMIVFFRSAIGLLVLLPWLLHRGAAPLRTQRLRSHVLRSLCGLASMFCFFYAIGHMPLAEAVLLNYSAPLFMPFVAWLWLGERISRRLLAAIVLGFVGVALILKPGLALFTPAALVGIASGVLAALAMVGIRGLSRTEPVSRIVFYFSLVCTLVSAIPLWWSWQTPAAHLWMLLFSIGACASLAQLAMTRGYGFAPAAQIGPFTYATVIFAALLGWVFWGEVPDVMSVVGATIVCVTGILTIRFGAGRATPVVEGSPAQR